MIHNLIDHQTTNPMDDEMLVTLESVVRKHPWWIQRAKLTEMILRAEGISIDSRILDVGCGWGVTMDYLEGKGWKVDGLDISIEAVRRRDRPDRNLYCADLALPLTGRVPRSNVILLLDVLEHIDDDAAALANAAEALEDTGLALISVPAQPRLFSEFDRIQGHRRRYLEVDLINTVRAAGLVPGNVWNWGVSTAPLVALQRKRQKTGTYSDYLKLPPAPGPAVLSSLYAFDSRLALRGVKRMGTSLFIAARKPK